MKSQTKPLFISLLAIVTLLFPALSAHSAPIANWKMLSGSANNSGLDTDSPTIGDGTPDNADNAWVAGRFGTVGTPGSVTLEVGETLTVSGSVVLTGGVNERRENFRVGLSNAATEFENGDTTFPNGGWLLVPSIGIFQARTDGAFVSNLGNAVNLGGTPSANTAPATFVGNSTTPFAWSFSITRASATTVDLAGSFSGGDGNYGYAIANQGIETSLFTYNVVGVLFGGALDLDQGDLSDVQYSVTVPTSSDPRITSFSVSGSSATVVMTGEPGTDYYCAGSNDLTDWTTEIVPTDTPGSPFQTDANGDLAFTVDTSLLPPPYFLRVQDTDPSP
jgi:hypothetical protein